VFARAHHKNCRQHVTHINWTLLALSWPILHQISPAGYVSLPSLHGDSITMLCFMENGVSNALGGNFLSNFWSYKSDAVLTHLGRLCCPVWQFSASPGHMVAYMHIWSEVSLTAFVSSVVPWCLCRSPVASLSLMTPPQASKLIWSKLRLYFVF